MKNLFIIFGIFLFSFTALAASKVFKVHGAANGINKSRNMANVAAVDNVYILLEDECNTQHSVLIGAENFDFRCNRINNNTEWSCWVSAEGVCEKR